MIREKEQTIMELKETIEILELKIKKLEQLVRLKDSKIQSLTEKLSGQA
jgi:chaperonin cofactor prefoldin